MMATRTKSELFRVATCLLAVTTTPIGVSCSSSSRDNTNLTSDAAGADVSGSWSIFLRSFSGADSVERASRFAQILMLEWQLDRVFVEPRDTGAAVLFGRYDDPQSSRAISDLERLRSMGQGDAKLFEAAFFLHRKQASDGRYPEIALVSARTAFGEGTLFTLQVGVYESRNRLESMRAAEDAALELRQQGEEAYYHHGVSRSMVTIGVFTLRDYDPQSGRMSQRLEELRVKYPHNLFNGMGLREHTASGQSRLQSSGLVMVPD
ncbi:MAG: hypothetical protein ACF8GE_10590 [Phycisphaerales bacterium JB043]